MASIKIGGIALTGNDISIINNKIYIDGKLVEDDSIVAKNGILEVKITEGVVENLSADGSVSAGSVKGNINAGGSINCDCVGGSVNAGGSVRCGRVGGNVQAGGSIRHA